MSKPTFAPQLYIKSGVHNVDFYTKAFGAVELRRWTNDDGSIHVVEFSIEGTLFHLHEESPKKGNLIRIRIKAPLYLSVYLLRM
jgi:PhnB protein